MIELCGTYREIHTVSWPEILKEGSCLGKLGMYELNSEMDVRCAGPQYDLDEVGTVGGLFGRGHGPSVCTKCEKILDHLKGCLPVTKGRVLQSYLCDSPPSVF